MEFEEWLRENERFFSLNHDCPALIAKVAFNTGKAEGQKTATKQKRQPAIIEDFRSDEQYWQDEAHD